MRTLTVLLIIALFASCDLIPAIAPDDWAYHPPAPDTTSTIPTDSVIVADTCAELIEITDPAFSTLYVKFDNPHDSILWEGGGYQSYSLAEIVSHVSNLPAKIRTGQIGASVILKGTNNHAQFQLKIFARVDGAKWYMGTAKQGLILPGADAAYYKEVMNEYPSFDQFSFYGGDCSCDQGVSLCREVLKDCHAGRWYADLFFLPCQPPQSVRDSLDLYGWERIRANRKYIIDLRGEKGYNLQAIASTGAQIIVCE